VKSQRKIEQIQLMQPNRTTPKIRIL